MGRELCYDMFYLLAKNIEELPNIVESETQLKTMLSDIDITKNALRHVCRVIIDHDGVKHEDGIDFFSMDQWKLFHKKVRAEKFKEERSAIEKGRSFATALKTPMGEAVESHMLSLIQKGYVFIDEGKINIDGIYEMNIYRAISQLWDKRISDYKKNIERVRKIIYKEKS